MVEEVTWYKGMGVTSEAPADGVHWWLEEPEMLSSEEIIEKMEVTVKSLGGWDRVVDAVRLTVHKESLGKEPSGEFKRSILLEEHSPIMLLEFEVELRGVEQSLSVHLVRHFMGVNWFVGTSREDPVDMKCVLNALDLINISRRRLCSKADPETRKVWREVVEAVRAVDPYVASCCVPNCVYRGRCPEMQGCGWDKSEAFKSTEEAYWL